MSQPSRPAVAPAPRVVVPAGTTAGTAVREAELPTRGPDTIVVVRDADGQLRDLSWAPESDTEVEAVAADTEDGRAVIRHSSAHVLAQAVQQLFPEAKLGIGPPVKDGFYYDFDVARPFTPEDLQSLEKRMKQIIKGAQRFSRREVESVDAARTELAGEPYKLELVDLKRTGSAEVDTSEVMEVGSGGLTIYDNLDPRSGERVWGDLCRGPHVPTTKFIPAVKLTRSAAAYWRGSEKNPQLQRIYGTAFPNKTELEAYLKLLEEAKRRDHRKLGKELDLFAFHPAAPGAVFWTANGTLIFTTLQQAMRRMCLANGYFEIKTPLLYNKQLWEKSGHWGKYRENMFLILDPEAPEGASEEERASFSLKP
ncbi:MAG TPA: threonine--tRNA ligase, partial [Pseudonocardiaceae bacterium]|nr:threonine--tRNA ligase [Pseudonocardiaceae bacterium]